MALPPIFTPAELAEVAAYHRPYYVLAAVSDLLDVAVLFCLLRFWVRPFHRWAEAGARWLAARTGRFEQVPVVRVVPKVMDRLWGGPGWGTALLFAAYGFLAISLLYLPLDIFFAYVLEHRHGMSTQGVGGYLWDSVKGWSIRLSGRATLVVGLYGLARRLPRWWAWLGAAAGLGLLLTALLDPYLNRVTFDYRPLPEGPLRQRIVAVLRAAGVEFHDIVVEEVSKSTRRAQAYFLGQGPTRTIVLTDTLVAAFPEEEIEVAVAHEAGHVREHKLPGNLAAALTMVAFLFALDRLFGLAARRGWFGATERADIRTLPLVTVTMYAFLTVAIPISAAFSREREREADRYALALTHKPETFQAMLVRLARMNKLDPSPPEWVVVKGFMHPPIGERLELAERLKSSTGHSGP